MSERYSRLFGLPENLYTQGAPLLIAAGALLKDNETGKVLAQLKFRNISEKRIQAVKVSITAFDVAGKEIPGVKEYQYLDLSAGRDGEFGQKQPIPMPDKVTRSIGAECTEVVFVDGSVWNAAQNAEWKPLPSQQGISEKIKDGALVAQYRRDTTEKARFVPLDYADLWLCACGEVNGQNESACRSCYMEKGKLLAAFDPATLETHKAAFDKAQEEKQIKKQTEKTKQKAKVRKIAVIAAAAFALVLAVALLFTQVILPSQKYNAALALMETLQDDRQISAAAIAFGNLGDYKDSQNRSQELWNKIAVRETVSAGAWHTVGLKADGTVVAVGRDEQGQCDISTWSNIVSISVGSSHTVGLKADGTVVAVGSNKNSQCDISSWSDIVSVSAGGSHTVGLKADGTVVAVGWNEHSQCDVSSWSDIVALSASDYHTVGLKLDGTVVAVGNNDYGQCNMSSWSDIVAISAGDFHTIGLKSDGTVVAVGYNKYNQCDVSDWSDIVAVSASQYHTIGLKSDGTVVVAGNDKYGQCNISGWSDIIAVSTSDRHTVGLKSDGTVVTVGDNEYGQCDVSDWTNVKMA